MKKVFSLLFFVTIVIIIFTACNGNNKTSVVQEQVNIIKNGLKQFSLDERESEILTERLMTIGDKYNDYKFTISSSDSYYNPNIKKEEVANSDNVINISGYFSLLNPHTFIYGTGVWDNRDKENNAARISNYLGKGIVEGREVYAILDSIAYSSILNSGERRRSIEVFKVYLYQIDDTNIKKVGEIKKSKAKDGKETVSWYQDNLIESYPIKAEKNKEYYSDIYLNEPNKTYQYIFATGFKNLTIDENYFKNCLEMKKISVGGNIIYFNTYYYAGNYGMVYCEVKHVNIDKEKKEITFYPSVSEYFIENGKGEWTNLPLNITSFVGDQKQGDISTKTRHISEYKITKEEGLQVVKSKVKIETNFTLVFSSIKKINGKDYYIYVLNGKDYTVEDCAYGVDVNTGEVFKCSNSFELSPIN